MERISGMMLGWWMALLLLLVGCADDSMPTVSQDAGWTCPAQWVPHAIGGCGPAVLLCRPDGGAAPGVCDRLDLTHPHSVGDRDSGTGTTFYWLPDGGIGGGWPESLPDTSTVAAGGNTPSADWAPDAGIPSCPAPWRRLDDGTCESVFPDNCRPNQQYPDMGDIPVGTTVLHVQSGTTVTPATGSSAAPFPTITAALAAARGATWIRVGAGRYEENVTVSQSVRLVGCRQSVTWVGTGDPMVPTITVVAPGVLDLRYISVSNVAIVDSHASMTGVVVTGSLNVGVVVHGFSASLTVIDSVIQANSGVGLAAEQGAAISAERVLIDANHVAGMRAASLARIEARDVIVTNTQGYGVQSSGGGVISLTGALIGQNAIAGVVSISFNESSFARSRVNISQSVIRATRLASPFNIGVGVWADEGGEVSISRVLVLGNSVAGIFARGIDSMSCQSSDARRFANCQSHIRVLESIVAGTASPVANTGHGILARDGGEIEVDDTRIFENEGTGIFAYGTVGLVRSTVVARRSVIIGRRDGTNVGCGLLSQRGSRITADYTLIQNSRFSGVAAYEVGGFFQSELTLNDCIIRDTFASLSDQDFGDGIFADHGGAVTANRTLVERSLRAGVEAKDVSASGRHSSRVTLSDCVVRDTQGSQVDHSAGFGVIAEFGGVAEIRRTEVGNSHTAGVACAFGEVDISDSVIRDSALESNAHIWGVGLAAVWSGTISGRRLLIERSQEGGVVAVGPLTNVRLVDSIVAENTPMSLRGGFGYAVAGGGNLVLTRAAASHVRGAGFASVPDIDMGSVMGSTATVEDGFLQGVEPSPIQYEPCNPRQGNGLPRAYGTFVGSASELNMQRVVILDGDAGGANWGGTYRFHDGIVSGFRQNFIRGSNASYFLQNVSGNLQNQSLITDDPSLPNENLPLPRLSSGALPSDCLGGTPRSPLM